MADSSGFNSRLSTLGIIIIHRTLGDSSHSPCRDMGRLGADIFDRLAAHIDLVSDSDRLHSLAWYSLGYNREGSSATRHDSDSFLAYHYRRSDRADHNLALALTTNRNVSR